MEPISELLSSRAAGLRWLVHMRWHAAAGAAAAIALGRFALDLALPLGPLAATIAAIAASNVALARCRAVPIPLGLVNAIDAVLLTLLLAWSGGPANPFAVLYLPLVTVAGQLGGLRRSCIVFGISAIGYASLFAWHHELPELAALHPYGFAAALAIGGGAHAFSIGRLAAALRAHQAELNAARARVARAETLAAVGTLAVGAAHELGTPLGAIAIAASDLEHLLRDQPDEVVDEARAIRDEVDRCRAIIDRMAARAGVTIGEVPAPTTATALFERLAGELDADHAAWLEARVARDATFGCPVHGLVHVLANLVRNAVQASEGRAPVTLTAEVDDVHATFVVEDEGRGVPAEALPRLGEPFFTTRPGAGMGLGLYLCRTYAELWGGRLTIAARGRGTRVVLELPRMEGAGG